MEYRKQYDMMVDDPVEIIGTEDGILLRPYNPKCIFCKGDDDVQEHLGQLVCRNCREHFKKLGTGGKE
jgi:transcriptional pleiotropic regulator of transition state genes